MHKSSCKSFIRTTFIQAKRKVRKNYIVFFVAIITDHEPKHIMKQHTKKLDIFGQNTADQQTTCEL